MNVYRQPNFLYVGAKVRVVCNDATHFAKIGEIGTIVGQTPPDRPGWIVRFKGVAWLDLLFLFPLMLDRLWRRQEHLFDHQLELIEN